MSNFASIYTAIAAQKGYVPAHCDYPAWLYAAGAVVVLVTVFAVCK